MRQAICWGVTHNSGDQCQSKFAKQWLDESSDENDGRNSQNSQNSHYNRQFSDEKEELSDYQEDFNKTVRESCPFIPDMVYEHLPEFFKPLILKTANRGDTDNVFVGTMATVGAAMPNVTVQVRQKSYSSNGYFCIIGPAGSGKELIAMAPSLLDTIQKRMDEENDNMLEEYEKKKKKKLAWDFEIKQANKEKRLPNANLHPRELPEFKTLVTEPQASRSKLISTLAYNPDGLSYLYCHNYACQQY